MNARSTARKRASSIAPKRGNRPARAVDLGTKNQILEAALTAFARDGFDGASLPKIAEIAKAIIKGAFDVRTQAIPLSDVTTAWTQPLDGDKRIVDRKSTRLNSSH